MKRLLIFVLVLQVLVLVSQLTGPGSATPAWAQIPDAGAQRNAVIEELRTLNGKMDKLMEMLESGKIQVKATLPDDKAASK
jgi:hypothetical protein